MTTPTAGERSLGAAFGFDPAAVATARDNFNVIALLPWPEPERVSLLSRLARAAKADVGSVLGRRALALAPLKSFDALIPVIGLAQKRVTGLVRALATLDVATLAAEAAGLRALQARLASLETANAALQTELDRLYAAGVTTSGSDAPSVMRLGDVASSISSQLALVDQTLRSAASGLRLSGVELQVRGQATAVEQDLALDFNVKAPTTEIGMSFVPADAVPKSGRENVMVPNVTGYTRTLAQRKLRDAGFAISVAAVSDGLGVVQRQAPEAGSLATPGSLVRVLVG